MNKIKYKAFTRDYNNRLKNKKYMNETFKLKSYNFDKDKDGVFEK